MSVLLLQACLANGLRGGLGASAVTGGALLATVDETAGQTQRRHPERGWLRGGGGMNVRRCRRGPQGSASRVDDRRGASLLILQDGHERHARMAARVRHYG